MKKCNSGVMALIMIFVLLVVIGNYTVQALQEKNTGLPIVVTAVAPDETMGSDKVKVSVEIEVPEQTAVYGIDLSLYYEMRYYIAGEYTVELPAQFSSGSLERIDNEYRFLYDSQNTPIVAGKYTLFTVEFTIVDSISDRESVFDVLVRQAYAPYTNEEGELELVDLAVLSEPANVFIGERLKATPANMKLYVGQTAQIAFNKEYASCQNSNETVVAFNGGNNTVSARSPGIAELTFRTNANESVSVEIEVYQPDPRLQNLVISNAELTPEFNPDIYAYTARISNLTEGLDVGRAKPMDGMSSVMIENPMVQAGGRGTAFITVTAENGLQKIYMITVIRESDPGPSIPTQITSAVYGISGNTLHKVKAGTTVTALVNGIQEKDYVTVYKADGTRAADGDAVGTGYQIKLPGGQTWMVVVTGDANGDGKITAADYVKVKFHVLKKQLLQGAYQTAADVNADGNVTAADYVNIKFYVLGKTQITPR